MDSKLIQRNLIGILVVTVIVVLVVFAVHSCIRSALKTGITSRPDKLFGEQHLGTAVALIELHKLRYGQYPQTLKDLKFTGEWDAIALNNVAYYPNADKSAYFISVERGWIGKPKLEMPDEFWQGTGYDPVIELQRSLKDF